MAAAIITLVRLREILEYFPLTGLFAWRVNRRGHAKAGDVAGSLRPNGYIQIEIDGRLYRAHRLAWLWMTGTWPAADIDHIDWNRANNRWDNLREATRSENNQNQRKAHSDNLSCGLLGVTWDKQRGKWMAQIGLDGKKRHLGYFPTAELAHATYLAAKRQLHPFGNLSKEGMQWMRSQDIKDAARYRLIASIVVDMGHCYEIPLEPGATLADTIDAACRHA